MDPATLRRYVATFSQPGYSYGEWPERKQVGLILEMPTAPVLSAEADAFWRDVHQAGWFLRDPDWPRWRGEAQRLRDDPDAPLDVEAAKRFFTVAVRTDHAMPGFLLQVMREGTVLRILQRLS